MSSSEHDAAQGAFDRPALWRAAIIQEFRLRGAERCAASSPAPGFPQLFDSLFTELETCGTRWLDVGGGLGGIASWVERNSAAEVILVDPAVNGLFAARQLFPTLAAAVGEGERLPVREACIDVVMLNGVVSLVEDVTGIATEVRRVLAFGGRVMIADIWSESHETVCVGPITVHSLEAVRATWGPLGFDVVHLAIADTSTGWWPSAAAQVNNEVVARHAADEGFAEWHNDLCHLDSVLESGGLIVAGLVLDRVDTVVGWEE
jgi:ubiquinone/menaquinone biosynthesis C-methylase UbiE